MDESIRHKKLWKVLNAVICPVFSHMMRFSGKKYRLPSPTLVIANHVTNFDPFLVAASFPKDQIYFVASEHLFRKGFLSKMIHYLVGPIARRKGSTGGDAAMAMLRKLRAGHSVCIFGEGETSWNGENHPFFPGTGDIARIAGATLVTYRLEGGYLTAPRWGKGIRKGKMQGSIVNTYPPDVLKNMTSQEIAAVIDRDLHENAWERQKAHPQLFRGKNRAQFIETALFLCPKCHRYSTIRGEKNQVKCSCGLSTTYTEYGLFDPPVPFENMLQWDEWQHAELEKEPSPPPFRDEKVTLLQLMPDHTQVKLTEGILSMYGDSLRIHGHCFLMQHITHMALVKTNILMFTCQGIYYEVHARDRRCFRKYLAVWHNLTKKE